MLSGIFPIIGIPPSDLTDVIESPANERPSAPAAMLVENSPAQDWLGRLASALAKADSAALRRLFLPDGYWRDHLALTWDFRTFGGPALIAAELMATAGRHPLCRVRAEEGACKVFEHRKIGRAHV